MSFGMSSDGCSISITPARKENTLLGRYLLALELDELIHDWKGATLNLNWLYFNLTLKNIQVISEIFTS